MRRRACSGCSLIAMAFLLQASCTKNNASQPDAVAMDGGQPDSSQDGGCKAGTSNDKYVLIDDMEMGTNGPIGLDGGISPPRMPGYWYNSGARYSEDGGTLSDTSNPEQGKFAFTALPSSTTTLNCHSSTHAARQACTLNGLYDTCGVGFEFAQEPDPDAGSPPAGTDGGDPRVTVPFDISRYKAFTFWGMTTTPDPMTNSLAVKVQLPDTDTDPRGQVCNGGGGNTSKCYNSYGATLKFTTSWQQFTVLLDPGQDGVPPEGGIAIDPSWGYQDAMWLPTQVYGINWQAQRNIDPDAGPPLMTDIWIDDVYFKE